MNSIKKCPVVCFVVVGLMFFLVGMPLRAQADYASPYARLEVFSRVLALIERNHVDNVTKKDVIKGAIEGMVRALDPHSSYLSPEEFKMLQEDTSGTFCGVGMEVGIKNEHLTVIAPIANSPAAAAGMLSGDVIVRIEGVPFSQMDMVEAVQRMRGKEGTDVTITVKREGIAKAFKVTLTRAPVEIEVLVSKMLIPGYLHVHLRGFSAGVAKKLKKAIKDAGPVQGLVLDLRGNPGGLLTEAVAVSELFLSVGKIVSIRGRDKEMLESYNAKKRKVAYEGQLVVVLDAGSASASEIVAGALKDNKRAIIVGRRSFGKGSVQTIIPLNDGSGLKLTTALYYTPAGTSIQATGILPDVVVAQRPETVSDDVSVDGDGEAADDVLSERDLSGHIENGDKPIEQDLPAMEDRQLRIALGVLQGLVRVAAGEKK